MTRPDFLVIGAGVVGVTIALELKARDPSRSVVVLEKEATAGLHASGRNSGVLHSGIYYSPQSLKARVCSQGAREMAAYCRARDLPLVQRGKVLVPIQPEDMPQLDVLLERGRANGVTVERIDQRRIAELEPEVRSATGEALFVPTTMVGSPQAVMRSLVADARAAGIELRFGAALERVDAAARCLWWGAEKIQFGHVINAAGLHADSVAHAFGAGEHYTMLPFKGLYWKLDPASGIRVNHLVYPVPDLRVPFLGVHTTTTTDGTIYLGPTAVPAFGRENYRGVDGIHIGEAARFARLLLGQLIAGHDGFRRYALQEGRRYFRPWFAEAARALIPRLKPSHLLRCDKVGIRAQLVDRRTGRLVNDFLVETGRYSTHVLNAISPAWTGAFPFARLVVDQYVTQRD
jgi:L-2-hydroxyglutarate oxidase LhgO